MTNFFQDTLLFLWPNSPIPLTIHLNSMKIGEVVVINVFKNFTKIHSYLNEKQKSSLNDTFNE